MVLERLESMVEVKLASSIIDRADFDGVQAQVVSQPLAACKRIKQQVGAQSLSLNCSINGESA
jgi:hypothetical protein